MRVERKEIRVDYTEEELAEQLALWDEAHKHLFNELEEAIELDGYDDI